MKLLRDTYHLEDNSVRIVMDLRLRGKAVKWFHSKPDHLRMMVTDLLDKLYAFLIIDHVKQRCAKSSKDESFCEYYFDKVTLINEVTIHQEELVDFITDGFSDIRLRDQAGTHRLYRNTSFAEPLRNNRDRKEVTNLWISKTL